MSKYSNKYLDKNISVIETYNKNKSIGLYFKNLHEGRDNIQFSKLVDYYKIK